MTGNKKRGYKNGEPPAEDAFAGGVANDLRKRAELHLAKTGIKGPRAKNIGEQLALHELQVYQIELQMQNIELRRNQAELEIAKERYFNLYDLAPVGYITYREDTLITEANLTIADMLGAPRSELLQKTFNRFIFSVDQDIFYLANKQLWSTHEAQTCEVRLVPKTGEAFWVTINAILQTGTNRELSAWATVNNINARRLAEEALRASEAHYRALTEKKPES